MGSDIIKDIKKVTKKSQPSAGAIFCGVSLIMGALGFILSWRFIPMAVPMCILSIIAGTIGIVMGDEGKMLAVVGIICSILSIIPILLVLIIILAIIKLINRK